MFAVRIAKNKIAIKSKKQTVLFKMLYLQNKGYFPFSSKIPWNFFYKQDDSFLFYSNPSFTFIWLFFF